MLVGSKTCTDAGQTGGFGSAAPAAAAAAATIHKAPHISSVFVKIRENRNTDTTAFIFGLSTMSAGAGAGGVDAVENDVKLWASDDEELYADDGEDEGVTG